MAADLATIRQAISDAADEIDGLRCSPYRPDQVQVPQFYVEPEGVDFRTAFKRGHESWTFLGELLLGEANSLAAQKNRDAYFSGGGASDLKDAIEASTDLHDGTAAQAVFVSEARNFPLDRIINGTAYTGVELVIEVIA